MKRNLLFYMIGLRSSFLDYYKERMEEINLSKGQQYFILAIGSSKMCSPNSISQLVKMDAGHTTRYINKLVDSGFVVKTPNPNDGRSCFLELTIKGKEAYEKSRNVFADWIDNRMKRLSHEEGKQILNLLAKLLEQKEDENDGQKTIKSN
ncbi:bilirubin utilization transcriptional regulator BilQ [Anaerorhabdus sp.]|uniref:bilirubin utilization transcriptional regulator BilQ n=1 Tax=Anaerorhabdus sp. TaxID=1872524 RepID=UPI002B1F50F4|nr:bilirubin utilization transcriptional regulator BilQ [Anaerorhabdus sp.]MEA4876064.1 MarR family winged helix-turn-helix transcriptional regulator [Anaerorhabdus sp.]